MPFTKDFKKLLASVEGEYLDKPVPKKYRKEYGKRYDKKELKVVAIKIANKLGIKRH